jgi:hypothetical protein
MANPTTNFGWQMPTSTDLVTDLPADFEVFGQAVDTTLVDLKGGTTGQVLSKASNTNMDFTWVTTDDANAIQNTIVDAKGDLISATGSDVPARLAVGNNGETLVADSSTSTGLRYQPSTGRNFALNSDFTIWQRGTTITPTTNGGAYCADRWFITRGNNTSITATQQTAGNLSTTPNQAFRYYARVQRTAGSTTTSNVDLGQMFETSQVTLLAGQTVTFSGYIRKGANFSATSDVIKMQIIEGTGTDQKQMDGGYTGGAFVVDTAKTLTSSWQRFSVTGTVATTSTEITIKFSYTPTGTAGAADYFDVVGAQLELGSVPTAWNLATGTLQGELAACQRYYYKSPEMSVVPGAATYSGLFRGGSNASGNRWVGAFSLPSTMRTSPTCVVYNPQNGTAGQMRNEDAGTNVTVSGIFGQYTNTVTQIDFSPSTSANNVIVGYITASAEL